MALSPVERGVLIVLMAQGEPTKQADLQKKHGLNVLPKHREKLVKAGLIEVKSNPIKYTLTKDGRERASQEATEPKPKGSRGLAPLHAALGAIDRLAKQPGLPSQDALKPEGPRPTEWIEADEYIARALQDIPVFGRALSRLRDAAGGKLGDEIERAELSAELVFQHIRLAGRKRALALEGEVGEETAFDPVRFLSDDDVTFGEPVRIRKPPVTRAQGADKIIVQPGFAEQII